MKTEGSADCANTGNWKYNRQVGAFISGLVQFHPLIGGTNNILTIFTPHDMFGNPVSPLNKVNSVLGVATSGASNGIFWWINKGTEFYSAEETIRIGY